MVKIQDQIIITRGLTEQGLCCVHYLSVILTELEKVGLDEFCIPFIQKLLNLMLFQDSVKTTIINVFNDSS